MAPRKRNRYAGLAAFLLIVGLANGTTALAPAPTDADSGSPEPGGDLAAPVNWPGLPVWIPVCVAVFTHQPWPTEAQCVPPKADCGRPMYINISVQGPVGSWAKGAILCDNDLLLELTCTRLTWADANPKICSSSKVDTTEGRLRCVIQGSGPGGAAGPSEVKVVGCFDP